MIRRRSTISIYDYPEHLNPFREERRESIGNKFRSFGQRGSSFRNAWNLLLPRSKRSQSFTRESTSPPPLQPGYDTWTVRRTPRSQQEVFGLPASWTISPSRRYTPPNSVAGSPPRSPANNRGSQLSVATLAVDVPSSDERLQLHGARPKKKRAPLPPTSPSGSSANSSSSTSLRDGRRPEDTKDEERESLQVLVSRIQQEFGEDTESTRRRQDDDLERKESSGPATTSRVQETSLQVEKPFVVEPRVQPASDDAEQEGSSATDRDGTSEETTHVGSEDTSDKEDSTLPVDHSENAPESDAATHEPQVPAKVFVETTSRTISSNGGTIITAPDDVETSATTEPENGAKTKDKQESVTEPAENQAEPSVQDQNVCSNDLNGANSEMGSSVASEDAKPSPSESSTSECQVETVSGRYESGAFVVSTSDTASVYEDAASEVDFEVRDVRTTLNGRHKPTPQETTTLDSQKVTADVSNGGSDQFHTRTSLAVSSVDAKPSRTVTSQNLEPKPHSIATPRYMSAGSATGGRAFDPENRNTDTSDGRVSHERTFSNSLKHQTSFTVTAGHSSASTHKNGKDGVEATSGNRAPATPREDITSRTNGDIARTPVTAPRGKPSNGLPQQSSSATVSSDGSSAGTPTPPPRNKPQPVPRMKRLRKLFSNQ